MSTLESAADGVAMGNQIDTKQKYCTRIAYILKHRFHDLR